MAEDEVRREEDEEREDEERDDGVLRLKSRRNSIPVEIEDENGRVERYTLYELTGPDRDKHLNDMSARTKWAKDGSPAGVEDFRDLQPSLLAMCLVDDAGKPVRKALIRGWPASTQQALFEAAQKLSGLAEGAVDLAKNG